MFWEESKEVWCQKCHQVKAARETYQPSWKPPRPEYQAERAAVVGWGALIFPIPPEPRQAEMVHFEAMYLCPTCSARVAEFIKGP